jgi:hypothetical protein
LVNSAPRFICLINGKEIIPLNYGELVNEKEPQSGKEK